MTGPYQGALGYRLPQMGERGVKFFGGYLAEVFFLKKYPQTAMILSGLCAGAVNGLFGAGGGMVLVPMLTKWGKLPEKEVFPTSVAIILPVSIVSLLLSAPQEGLTFTTVLPYLTGSLLGGVACGILGKHIPVKWLHRVLGLMILWGGLRYLC